MTEHLSQVAETPVPHPCDHPECERDAVSMVKIQWAFALTCAEHTAEFEGARLAHIAARNRRAMRHR